MPTLSPSSSHTWQTYLSPRPLFHPNSNWHLSPLLKKPGLPKSNLANFRPISNLNTIGKILECLALSRFFLTFQNLPVFLLYSLFIVNFILLRLLCLSSQMISWKPLTPEKLQFSLLWTCPQLLTLWTTLNFFIYNRLQHTFGLSGYVIFWIRSYLTDRSSFVKIDSSSSPSTAWLNVLGPLLFVLFISPIANVINSYQSNQNSIVSFHQYAGDTQLYIGTNSSTLTSQIASIESCSQRVQCADRRPSQTQPPHVHGKILVSNLQTPSRTLVGQADNKLDYCNSLFLNLNCQQTNRLQLILNSTARAVTKTPKYNHITPHLKSLHWLKITQRIQYKILSLTYKSLQFKQPSSILDFLKFSQLIPLVHPQLSP